MKIYAPSYKRSDGVKTHKIIPEVIYCVHEFEEEKYRNLGYNIEVLPDNTKGNIARVRNYILKNFIKKKGLIIDDDIEDIKRWNLVNGKPKQERIYNTIEWIEQCFNMAEESGCRLWGVNILGDKGSYREYSPISFTNTVSASFMGFINNELSFDERLPLKDDYDFCLQNLNEYRKILRINYASLVKKDHGNLGGCADYRTMSFEKEQLALLQKKWGRDIVKLDNTQRGKKIKGFDLNPIINAPIKGM
tara:strand:+ start:1081 stop:1824 length:744 start_codon:yes stop_codon:yes gene_type:complete